MSQYGTTLDVETVYRVRLDGRGLLVDSQYQSGVHQWMRFDGERLGDRPVLRVSSTNNMTSARITEGGAERWSDAPIETDQSRPGVDLLARSPWLKIVPQDELLREGKVNADAPGDEQLAALDRYVAVGPVSDAQRAAIVAAGGVRLTLASGEQVVATVSPDFASGENGIGGAVLPMREDRDRNPRAPN